MSYQHLSAAERFQLSKLQQDKRLSYRAIAKMMNRSVSTISRELQRNQVAPETYYPDSAQTRSEARRRDSKPEIQPIAGSCLAEIQQGLENYHSPEQITGRMKAAGKKALSHETIYKLIYGNHLGMGHYQEKLRHIKKKRNHRGSSKSSRGTITGRIGIEQRPEIANQKQEIGHWESDTMIGGNHQGVIVTHVDKASKFLIAGLARNKTAEAINGITMSLFSSIDSEKKKTMTSDNGKEFCRHQELAHKLGVSWYFANPYHSWERGLNEHTNGLIRQYFPKQTNFLIVKPEQLEKVVNLINHRPRKSLGYRTPFEVFYSYTSDSVALQI